MNTTNLRPCRIDAISSGHRAVYLTPALFLPISLALGEAELFAAAIFLCVAGISYARFLGRSRPIAIKRNQDRLKFFYATLRWSLSGATSRAREVEVPIGSVKLLSRRHVAEVSALEVVFSIDGRRSTMMIRPDIAAKLDAFLGP